MNCLILGVGDTFGYNPVCFSALQNAPAIEASLINYLWPLLIVVLSPVFFREFSLRPYHPIGSVCGLMGAGLIVTGGHINLDLVNLPGYLFAAGAALIWSCYSLLTKKVPAFPNAAVGGFCLISGILSLCMHFALEPAYSPNGRDWLFLTLLGVGPVGASYFTWTAALTRGDPRIIGSLSYLTPLTSTLVLVVLGGHPFKLTIAIAMVLIVSGAIIGSLDLFRRRTPAQSSGDSAADFESAQ